MNVVFLLLGCLKQLPNIPARSSHPLDRQSWLERVAVERGMSLDRAKELDRTFLDTRPSSYDQSEFLWEGAALFGLHCSGCHGLAGQGNPELVFDPAPRPFNGIGITLGFLLTGDYLRKDLHKVIRSGGRLKTESPMPPFDGVLANEQIWAIINYIETL